MAHFMPCMIRRAIPAGCVMPRIVVLAFEGVSMFHLSVPGLVFGRDRSDLGLPRHEVVVCAEHPGPRPTVDGLTVNIAHGLEAIASADIVVVPSWGTPETVAPTPVTDAVRAAYARGATVVGFCLGAFVLGDAGLLDGLPATTHWGWRDTFAERFPTASFQPDVLYVDTGRVITSAGTVAAIDCCLHLVRRTYGADVANRVARRLVTPPHRDGGQAQYIEQPVPERVSDDRLAVVIEWARSHLHEPLSIDALANMALMSRRNFTRRFREAVGTSAHRWIATERIRLAQQLLETTGLTIDQVAEAAGFGTSLSLRQRFAEDIGMSPSAYRRTFRQSLAAVA